MRLGLAGTGLALLAAGTIWLALSATVVLWPPATVGLVIVAASLAQGISPRPEQVLAGVRRHLAASVVWGVVNGALLALLYALDHVDPVAGALSPGQETVLKLAALLWLGLQLYALPLLLVQRDGRMLSAWRSALLLAVAAPVSTALVWAAAALGVALVRAWPVPFAVIVPGALALLGCVTVAGRLSAFGYPGDAIALR